MVSKELLDKQRKQRKIQLGTCWTRDNRNSGRREKGNIKGENKALKRRDIKVTMKRVDDARIFDNEGQDLKRLLKGLA